MASLPVTWHWRKLDELNPRLLHAILAARQEVFIVGQGLNYVDADAYDFEAWHLAAWHETEAGLELAAYLRLIPLANGATSSESAAAQGSGLPVFKIGRVLTRPAYRGQGLGIALMQHLLTHVKSNFGNCRLTMSAQSYLEEFYGKFGFIREGEHYLEEGLEHIRMSRDSIVR